MIRLIIADDHQMVREGLGRIVETSSDMEIVAEAADGFELKKVLGATDADVLLLDISMPGPGFLPLMEEIRRAHPELPILVVSMHVENMWAVQALKAGAAGYLAKTHSAEELSEGIRRVHAGGRYITNAVAEALALRLGPLGEQPAIQSLSKREFEVLQKLGAGKMMKTVALEMGLSVKTVSTYRTRILEKLSLGSTAEIIRFAVERDLLG
jgi:two-component system invasion response regulator UvrY